MSISELLFLQMQWLLVHVLNLHEHILRKILDNFVNSNQDELIKHCMRALRDTLPNEVELTVKVNFPFDTLLFSIIIFI